MRKPTAPHPAWAWACALLLALPSAPLSADAGEPFEVEMLRGSTHSLVTRDAAGDFREVTLREAPPTPAAEPAPEEPPQAGESRAPQTSVTVMVVTQPAPRILLPAFVGPPHRRLGWHRKPHTGLRGRKGGVARPAQHRGRRHPMARFRLPSW